MRPMFQGCVLVCNFFDVHDFLFSQLHAIFGVFNLCFLFIIYTSGTVFITMRKGQVIVICNVKDEHSSEDWKGSSGMDWKYSCIVLLIQPTWMNLLQALYLNVLGPKGLSAFNLWSLCEWCCEAIKLKLVVSCSDSFDWEELLFTFAV